MTSRVDYLISSNYKIYAIHNGKGLITVYGFISSLGTGTAVNIGATKFKCYSGSGFSLYAILNFYNHASPYEVVGSVWIDASGNVIIYKPSSIIQGYIGGSYCFSL